MNLYICFRCSTIYVMQLHHSHETIPCYWSSWVLGVMNASTARVLFLYSNLFCAQSPDSKPNKMLCFLGLFLFLSKIPRKGVFYWTSETATAYCQALSVTSTKWRHVARSASFVIPFVGFAAVGDRELRTRMSRRAAARRSWKESRRDAAEDVRSASRRLARRSRGQLR